MDWSYFCTSRQDTYETIISPSPLPRNSKLGHRRDIQPVDLRLNMPRRQIFAEDNRRLPHNSNKRRSRETSQSASREAYPLPPFLYFQNLADNYFVTTNKVINSNLTNTKTYKFAAETSQNCLRFNCNHSGNRSNLLQALSIPVRA